MARAWRAVPFPSDLRAEVRFPRLTSGFLRAIDWGNWEKIRRIEGIVRAFDLLFSVGQVQLVVVHLLRIWHRGRRLETRNSADLLRFEGTGRVFCSFLLTSIRLLIFSSPLWVAWYCGQFCDTFRVDFLWIRVLYFQLLFFLDSWSGEPQWAVHQSLPACRRFCLWVCVSCGCLFFLYFNVQGRTMWGGSFIGE